MAVTSDDVIASMRRWAARDGAGQHMMQRVSDITKKDDKTFVFVLKEPYGYLVDALGKTSTPLCFIMRKKEAETDPMEKITAYVGSGPFTFNETETKQGARYVYDRNPNYVPRSEPASGLAGGKVVKVDRVIFENMADSQTALAALQAGEIDFYETPPIDLIDQLEGDPNLKLEVMNKTGNIGWLRMNFLHPPFNNVDARRAMLLPPEPGGFHEGVVRQCQILQQVLLRLRLRRADGKRRQHWLVQGRAQPRQGQGAAAEVRLQRASRSC